MNAVDALAWAIVAGASTLIAIWLLLSVLVLWWMSPRKEDRD